ncbi:MAG: tRNA (adenosine(37)-N6)-threonylcarbamoyltransferase complex transferase subunit TsaD, partial [Candidatus Omnitrophica bacterium]|nr:tRNA (adenosine(37)-N6)-threonylcarbamoyltransferase complex transferase subunit TsaD [Candidatus Omnitrophota bacterium]
AQEISDIVASFQENALKVVVRNCLKALEQYKLNTLVVGGGVSANSRLREMFAFEASAKNISVNFPPVELCSDNAAMIAGLAYRLYKKGIVAGLDITVLE